MPAARTDLPTLFSAAASLAHGRRLLAACRRFWADERGSAVVDYVAVTALVTAAGIYAEHKVGVRASQMLQSVADAFPG